MLKLEYALDTYSVFNFNTDQIYTQFAMSGRFITAIIGKMVKLLGFSEYTIYLSSFIFALVCIALSMYKMYKLIKNDVQNKVLQILIITLIIINPFSIELFLFIEKGIMWFAVLMAICAVEKTIKYFDTGKIRYIFFGMFFIFIANCSYQGVVGIYASITLVYIIKYSKKWKDFIKNNVIVGSIYLVPSIIDFILIKILYPTGRISGAIVLNESIHKIFILTIEMIISTYQILPKYMLILFIFFTFWCFWYKIVKDKSIKQKIIEILKYLYIVLGIIIIAVLPQSIQSTDSIWFVPRSTYSFGSIYGVLLLYIFIYSNKKRQYFTNKKTKVIYTQLIIIGIILLITEFVTFTNIIVDRYKLNKIEEEISKQIVEEILDYEKMNENKIFKIQIYSDRNPGYTYPGIFATRDINIKAYSTDWSTKAIIEYYLKRNLIKEEQNLDLKQRFLNQDWDNFNIEEQLILLDNTLIICNY